MRDRAKLLRIVDSLFQSQPDKRHRAVGIAAIGRFDFIRDEIEGVKPAQTELQIAADGEFLEQADADLADAERLAVVIASSSCSTTSSLFSVISPRPNRVQSFQFNELSSANASKLSPSIVLRPQARVGRPPAVAHRPRIDPARRPALLVDAGLELLGLLEMRPAALQRQCRGRIPRQPHRGRIERPGLDVPAMLVGLAAVEARRLDLDIVVAPARRSPRRR